MTDRILRMAILALLLSGGLWLVYVLVPPLFLLIIGVAAMGAIVFVIRQIAFAIDRRMGGGRLR